MSRARAIAATMALEAAPWHRDGQRSVKHVIRCDAGPFPSLHGQDGQETSCSGRSKISERSHALKDMLSTGCKCRASLIPLSRAESPNPHWEKQSSSLHAGAAAPPAHAAEYSGAGCGCGSHRQGLDMQGFGALKRPQHPQPKSQKL